MVHDQCRGFNRLSYKTFNPIYYHLNILKKISLLDFFKSNHILLVVRVVFGPAKSIESRRDNFYIV
jgi:hypothetical protein